MSSIALLQDIYAPNNFTLLDYTTALQQIKTEKYKKSVERVNALVGSPAKYKTAKSNLASWAFNGSFKESITNANFDESSGLFHIDIDGLDNLEETFNDITKSCEFLLALWRSPSGAGLKGLIRIPDDFINNDADFKQAFKQIDEYFKKNNIKLDQSCKDVRRLCFVCSDKNIYINEDALPFNFKPFEKPKPKIINRATQQPSNNDAVKRILRTATNIIYDAGSGGYHEARIKAGKLAGGYVAAGLISENEVMTALTQASDDISNRADDAPAVRAKEEKAIYDGFQYGLSEPIEKNNIVEISRKTPPIIKSMTAIDIKTINEDDNNSETLVVVDTVNHAVSISDAVIPIKFSSELCTILENYGDYVNRKATQHGLIALISAVVSHKIETSCGSKTNLFIANSSKSIMNIDYIGFGIESILNYIEYNHVRSERYTSLTQLTHHYSVSGNRNLIVIPDDLGKLIKFSRRQPSGVAEAILATIQRLHRSDDISLVDDKNKKKVCYGVGINLYASLASSDFFHFSKTSELDNGIIPMCCTNICDERDFKVNKFRLKNVLDLEQNKKALEYMRSLSNKQESLNAGIKQSMGWETDPTAFFDRVIKCSDNELMKHYSVSAFGQFKAIVVTVCFWNGKNIADKETMTAVLSYVLHRVQLLIDELSTKISDDISDDVKARVYDTIYRSGKNGISQSRLMQSSSAFRKLDTEERRNLIDNLLHDDLIIKKDHAKNSRGFKYFAKDVAA